MKTVKDLEELLKGKGYEVLTKTKLMNDGKRLIIGVSPYRSIINYAHYDLPNPWRLAIDGGLNIYIDNKR